MRMDSGSTSRDARLGVLKREDEPMLASIERRAFWRVVPLAAAVVCNLRRISNGFQPERQAEGLRTHLPPCGWKVWEIFLWKVLFPDGCESSSDS